MRKTRERFFKVLSFWCLMLPAGVTVGLMVVLYRLSGLLRVRGMKNFHPCGGSVLLISNHPSLWEPIILAGLFFPWCMLLPWKYMPWSTPDQKNYTDKWYWGMFRPRFITVPRGKPRGERQSVIEITKVIRAKGNVVLFPEGGRTCKGESFIYSRSGKRMRPLKPGIGRILCRANCTVLPVRIDGAEQILPVGSWFPRVWKGMTVTFGKPVENWQPDHYPDRQDCAERVQWATKALLRAAR